jgi:hypothetical protein
MRVNRFVWINPHKKSSLEEKHGAAPGQADPRVEPLRVHLRGARRLAQAAPDQLVRAWHDREAAAAGGHGGKVEEAYARAVGSISHPPSPFVMHGETPEISKQTRNYF